MVEPESMVPFAHWTPPPIQPKRFLTWFFAAKAGEGEVAIDDGEIKQSGGSPRAAPSVGGSIELRHRPSSR